MNLPADARLAIKAAFRQAADHVEALIEDAEQKVRETHQWQECNQLKRSADGEFLKALLAGLESFSLDKEKEKAPEPEVEDDFTQANERRLRRHTQGFDE